MGTEGTATSRGAVSLPTRKVVSVGNNWRCMASPRPRLTTSQLKRLGRSLRHESLSEQELDLLQQFREEHFGLLERVQLAVRTAVPDARATSRLKTVQTIVDKLRREQSMALNRMRDIAGLRIVDEMDRAQQDVLVSEIRDALRALGDVKVIDRRKSPSHGYRAVHLELRCEGRYVEVQVRTRRQDQWAQFVESLGDTWGRQIRYGGGPNEPDRRIGSMTRREVWGLVLSLADAIDAFEDPKTDTAEVADVLASQLDGALANIAAAAAAGVL